VAIHGKQRSFPPRTTTLSCFLALLAFDVADELLERRLRRPRFVQFLFGEIDAADALGLSPAFRLPGLTTAAVPGRTIAEKAMRRGRPLASHTAAFVLAAIGLQPEFSKRLDLSASGALFFHRTSITRARPARSRNRI
jgi:hypothetical protein